jgi:lipoprotein NlpD
MRRRRTLSTTVILGCALLLAACAGRDASVGPAAKPAPSPARNEIYILVQRGQTLDAVAGRFKVAKADIIAINDLKPPYTLKPGAILKLPVAAQELNPETSADEKPAPLSKPLRPATTAAMTAPPAAAPARARRPVRPKSSEKPQPSAPQVIPLD